MVVAVHLHGTVMCGSCHNQQGPRMNKHALATWPRVRRALRPLLSHLLGLARSLTVTVGPCAKHWPSCLVALVCPQCEYRGLANSLVCGFVPGEWRPLAKAAANGFGRRICGLLRPQIGACQKFHRRGRLSTILSPPLPVAQATFQQPGSPAFASDRPATGLKRRPAGGERWEWIAVGSWLEEFVLVDRQSF